MRYLPHAVLCLISLQGFCATAHARESVDTYIGASFYALTIDANQKRYGSYAEDIFPKGYTGASIKAGIRPFRHFGFEAEYLKNGHRQSGNLHISEYGIGGSTDVRFRLWMLKSILYLPVQTTNGQIDAFGFVGFGRISYELTADISYASSNHNRSIGASLRGSKDGLPLGIGVQYRPKGQKFSGHVEYTRFTLKGRDDRETSDILALGLKYHF